MPKPKRTTIPSGKGPAKASKRANRAIPSGKGLTKAPNPGTRTTLNTESRDTPNGATYIAPDGALPPSTLTVVAENPAVHPEGEWTNDAVMAQEAFMDFQSSKERIYGDFRNHGLILEVDVYGLPGHRNGMRKKLQLLSATKLAAGSYVIADSGASLMALSAHDPRQTILFVATDPLTGTHVNVATNMIRLLAPAV